MKKSCTILFCTPVQDQLCFHWSPLVIIALRAPIILLLVIIALLALIILSFLLSKFWATLFQPMKKHRDIVLFFFFFLSRSGHRFEPFLTKDLFGHTVARTLWYYSWVQVYLLVMLLNYFRHSDQTLNVNLKYAAWI